MQDEYAGGSASLEALEALVRSKMEHNPSLGADLVDTGIHGLPALAAEPVLVPHGDALGAAAAAAQGPSPQRLWMDFASPTGPMPMSLAGESPLMPCMLPIWYLVHSVRPCLLFEMLRACVLVHNASGSCPLTDDADSLYDAGPAGACIIMSFPHGCLMIILCCTGNTTQFSCAFLPGDTGPMRMEEGTTTQATGLEGFDLFAAERAGGDVTRGVPSLADVAAADEVQAEPGKRPCSASCCPPLSRWSLLSCRHQANAQHVVPQAK